MKKILLLTTLSIGILGGAIAQDDEWDDFEITAPTFNGTRIINGHSTEVLEKKKLDVRILHRFGDLAVSKSGHSLYGLDQSTDIKIGLEYGVCDQFNIGFGRAKGVGEKSEIFELYGKYQLINESNDKPFSLSVAAITNYSGVQKYEGTGAEFRLSAFPKSGHRFSHILQLLAAKKISDRLSVQVSPTYVHRNYVHFDDQNGLLAVGLSGKYGFSQTFYMVVEYFETFRDANAPDRFVNPLGVGLEFKTSGHLFKMNFTNSKAISPSEFIPETTSKWGDGEFRFGFSIIRTFHI